MPVWAAALAAVSERLAHTLRQAMTGMYIPVTPLTPDRQSRSQAVVRARKTANKTVAASSTTRQRASRKWGPAPGAVPTTADG
jgi:hypothetical protein